MRAQILALCLASQLAQAAQNEQIDFKMNPSLPVVILSDFTLNPGKDTEREIRAPWFATTYSIKNGSNTSITLQTLKFTVVNSGGRETKIILKASDYAGVDACGREHNPAYLDFIPAESEVEACLPLFIDGLFDPNNHTQFRVTVEIMGWFGTPQMPVDRLSKSYSFETK
ncbi:MAG: hypothetical protein AB7N80_14010 [Bdellovibrionales bacterium]